MTGMGIGLFMTGVRNLFRTLFLTNSGCGNLMGDLSYIQCRQAMTLCMYAHRRGTSRTRLHFVETRGSLWGKRRECACIVLRVTFSRMLQVLGIASVVVSAAIKT